jgi:hypothetical protein
MVVRTAAEISHTKRPDQGFNGLKKRMSFANDSEGLSHFESHHERLKYPLPRYPCSKIGLAQLLIISQQEGTGETNTSAAGDAGTRERGQAGVFFSAVNHFQETKYNFCF